MKLYPAIDLRGGQAVRLYQGDYDQLTVYNADPVAQAQSLYRPPEPSTCTLLTWTAPRTTPPPTCRPSPPLPNRAA